MRLKNRLKLYHRLYAKRAMAYLIDYFLIKVAHYLFSLILLNSIFELVGTQYYITFENYEIASNTLLIITYLTYFILGFYLYNGQTIGMSLFNIQVKENGFRNIQLSLNHCLNRAFTNYLSHQLFFIPFFILLFNKDSKNLADILSNSQVRYFCANDNFLNQNEENIYALKNKRLAA